MKFSTFGCSSSGGRISSILTLHLVMAVIGKLQDANLIQHCCNYVLLFELIKHCKVTAIGACFGNIPFHRFISRNEAHTDETKIRQEDRESIQRKRIKAQKTGQKHSKTKHVFEFSIQKHAYTFTQLEATLPKHYYYSHSNVPHQIS